MTEKEFQTLLRNYLNGSATESERKAAEAFFNNYRSDAFGSHYSIDDIPSGDLLGEEILASIRQHLSTQLPLEKKRTISVYWRIAASVLLLMTVGLAVYLYNDFSAIESSIVDIRPGTDKAVLRLADGTIVPLDSASSVAIPRQGSAIVSASNGMVSYNVQSGPQELIYNTLVTPRGGQYQITLEDGTKVWLNSSSSLQYPVAFTSNERSVTLTGEAYFEVEHNPSRPFIIHVNDMDVRVYGTSFNVMAYNDEPVIKTTLMEGSVKIAHGNSSKELKPGQQMILGEDKILRLEEHADVSEALAWKNGRFAFEAADIATIMRQLSRWYNVDFRYEGNVQDRTFALDVPRKENVSALLRPMELTGSVHFEIQKDVVIVKPGKRQP